VYSLQPDADAVSICDTCGTCGFVQLLIMSVLSVKDFSLIPITGDGFCLYRSVEVSLKHQGLQSYTYRTLQMMVYQEIAENWSYYEPFCLASKTRSLADLDAYVNRGKFDQTIADVCVGALCNAVGITLIIYEEVNDSLSTTVHPPGRVPTRYTVSLLRSGSAKDRKSTEHYDVLLMKSPKRI
jgi:hypothetical protein